jgi:tetratricopeptide (TPR) repeat protein
VFECLSDTCYSINNKVYFDTLRHSDMKRFLRFLLWLLILISVGSNVLSQCKDNSASSSPAVIEKLVLFHDHYKEKKYKVALGPLSWLLKNAPTVNTNLYIMGADTYDELAKSEKDPAMRNKYVDSLMIVYDLRIKNCGEEANVMNRKAMSFFYFHYNNPARSKDILPLMDKAIELNKDKILDGLAENYMQGIKIASTQKLLSDDQILERYDRITKIIEKKIEKAKTENKPIERYQKMNEDNLSILSTVIENGIDCDFVRTRFGPQFRAKPDDLFLAKKIFNFMLKGKCSDDPLWLEAAEKIHTVEKDFGLAKIIGLRYMALKEAEMSAKLFAEALELAKTPVDRAEILGLQGHLQQIKGERLNARDFYRKAIALDPAKNEFYERIGDLYLNSFEDCKKGISHAEDRLVFLAAYDMYHKAGESRKMADAKASFPSREEVHELNHKPGDKVIVACWINEETIIRTRD